MSLALLYHSSPYSSKAESLIESGARLVTSKPQQSFCLCTVQFWDHRDMCSHSKLFTWVLGLVLRSNEPPPLSLYYFSNIASGQFRNVYCVPVVCQGSGGYEKQHPREEIWLSRKYMNTEKGRQRQ